jgi:uncharacterized protein (UPF0332 family)
MNKPELQESFKAIARALETIEAAEYDMRGNFTLAAINRIYYACYYCMSALLLTKNIYAKTHQGTRAKFSEIFIKTGLFPGNIAEHIKNAFDLRQEADYDFDANVPDDIANLMITKTRELHQLSISYLQTL